MKISISVPVYNAQDYLEACVGSVLNQNFKDFELILVDDGSTDASLDICRRYASEDVRVKVIHKSNGGVSSARNAGIEAAEGEYVMFLDADDELEDCALKVFYDNSSGADMVVADSAVYEDGRLAFVISSGVHGLYEHGRIGEFLSASLANSRRCLDSSWCKLYRREMLVETGLRFDERLSYAEDKLFVYSCLLHSRALSAVSKPLYRYYVREGSLGGDRSSDRHLMQLEIFLRQYADQLDRLSSSYPISSAVRSHYHHDLVGTYVCRALNILVTRKSPYQNKDFIKYLYGFMDDDKALGLFSLRPGQIFNIMLYKIGRPGLTLAVYRFTSTVISCIR